MDALSEDKYKSIDWKNVLKAEAVYECQRGIKLDFVRVFTYLIAKFIVCFRVI